MGNAHRRIRGDWRRSAAVASPPRRASPRSIGRQALEEAREDPDSPRLLRLERDARNLAHLRAFALPVIDALAAWPAISDVGRLARRGSRSLAPRCSPKARARAARPRRTAAHERHRPGLARGSRATCCGSTSARSRITRRRSRYGARVRRQPASGARADRSGSSSFAGLAERMFPQKPREDPMLLDRGDAPRRWQPGCRMQEDRAQDRAPAPPPGGWRGNRAPVALVPANRCRRQSRPRVPSFYALDIVRAITGHIPNHEAAPAAGTRRGRREARLAGAGPAMRDAIDDLEHDPVDAARADRRARPARASRATRTTCSA